MRVVLRKDVANLGKAGEIREVADGYGRNFLIPRGLAAPASKTAVQNVAAHHAAEARAHARLDAERQTLAQRIKDTSLVVHARTGDQGRLYGSVTSADIADALSRALAHTVDKRDIELDEPIRHLGAHTARVRIAPRVTATLNVVVEPE